MRVPLLLTVAALLCASLLISAAPEPGIWPDTWSTDWIITNHPGEDPVPPYGSVVPGPMVQGTGKTYYDWTTQSMLEIYYDFCVPIFSYGNDWRCRFLIVDQVSYLMVMDPVQVEVPKNCCVFMNPFHPPPPNFAVRAQMPYNTTTELGPGTGDRKVNWFVLDGPEPMPFGYGFEDANPNNPGGFFFRGYQGWTQQDFFNFQAGPVPSDVFDLPSSCKAALDNNVQCDF
jgi:hypothetical protein